MTNSKNIYNINNSLTVDTLQSNPTQLIFDDDFNQPLNQYSIPSSVRHLTFGENFNEPLNKYSLPQNITHLTFGDRYNQPLVQYSIPMNTTHLTFGWFFDQSLDQYSKTMRIVDTSSSRISNSHSLRSIPMLSVMQSLLSVAQNKENTWTTKKHSMHSKKENEEQKYLTLIVSKQRNEYSMKRNSQNVSKRISTSHRFERSIVILLH